VTPPKGGNVPGHADVAIEVGLNAVIVAVTDESPRILTVGGPDGESTTHGGAEGLPSGSLDPEGDRTLDLGIRRWVREQTGIELGYLEQLYTYGDRDRLPGAERRTLSIAYLALVREGAVHGAGAPVWRPWYDYFPWEDWRSGPPAVITTSIVPSLREFVAATADPLVREGRARRVSVAFGLEEAPWDPNRALDRYELLYEAGLVAESGGVPDASLGRPMAADHRRIVVSALERLRGKLSYRPVVFELLPEVFTLLQLQRVVEALVGVRLHKSNFRRLLEQARMVERTGTLEPRTGGRPAELFRFRREVLSERPAPGVGLPRRFAR
jgi:hypothetical protein